MILPDIFSWITGKPRYLPKIEWSRNCWTHNLFRVYEIIFWRRYGIRAEMKSSAWKEYGKTYISYEFYTWEALISHTEGMIRNFLKGFRFKFVSLPVIQTSIGANLPTPIFNFAIAFDAASNGVDENAGSLTVAHTVTGSNTMMISYVFDSTVASNVSSVKYNAVAETKQVTNDTQISGASITGWTLAAPTTGTNNVVITLADTGRRLYNGNVSLTGTAQSSYIDGTNSASGTSTSASVTITTGTANSWLLDGVIIASSAPTLTAGGSQTERYNNAAVRHFAGSTQITTSAGSYTSSWTISSSQGWDMAILGIALPGAATSVSSNLALLGVG